MLSKRIKNLKPSPTLALATLARELKAQGHDVIALSVGEPDWNTFDKVADEGINAIKDGFTKYVPASGIPELRKAVADDTNKHLNLDYVPNNVTVSAGAKFILFSALQALVDEGDEVIIPAPFWVSYPEMVQLAGGVPVTIEGRPENEFRVTASQISDAITSKTKVLLLNSPSNPTGESYSADEWKQIGEVLRKNEKVVVISDDIYNRLVFTGEDRAPHLLETCPDLKDRTVVINGASKSYSMTGWRVGWALGNEEVIKAMTAYQSQSVSCTPGFCQKAAVVALNDAEKELKNSVEVLKTRRDFGVDKLNEIDGISVKPPGGAFYLWTDVSSFLGKSFEGNKLSTTRDFSHHLLDSQKVAVVPGIDFGQDGFVRISYAIDEKRMGEAIERIREFCSKIS